MKKSWLNKLPFAEDLPFFSVDTDQDEQPSGGGGGDPDDITDATEDDSELGEAGTAALRKERQTRKERERELAQLKEQLKAVAEINPELYKQTQQRADELQRALTEKERETAEATKRIREKADLEVRTARQAAEAAKRERTDLLTRSKAQEIFRLNKGLEEVDSELGLTSFEAYWRVHGQHHFRWDDKINDLVVIDRDGDPITEDGKPVDPVKWLDSVADKSTVVAQYFKSKAGEGSGGIQGARNVRTVTTKSVEDLKKIRPSDLLDMHYSGR
jgi:hypothetical protein